METFSIRATLFQCNTKTNGNRNRGCIFFSKHVTQYIPRFVGMGLGKLPEDYTSEGKSRIPAFTMIGASNKTLIARGGSGGIAIWTRLEMDIRPAA